MKNKDQILLAHAYTRVISEMSEPESKPEKEHVTVRYEHRVIKDYNAGDYYGKDVIFKVGEVLETTRTPGKRRFYGVTLGHGAGADMPAENVGVFKVTKVTKVTETEERIE